MLIGTAGNAVAQSGESVLKTGTWYRLAVTKTGVHKLDAAYLRKIGLSTNGLNPQNIRIFGNGGAPLPQANARPRPLDLTENAILVSGEADGRFDAADAVYFFARSPHLIYVDSTAQDGAGPRLTHRLNPYSDTTYYYLTVTPQQTGLRIRTSPFSAPNAPLISRGDDYIFHEKELVNRAQSGREWYGESFGLSSEQTFSLNVNGLVAGRPALVTTALLSQGTDTTRFHVRWGGLVVSTHVFAPLSDYRYERKGIESRQTIRLNAPAGETIALGFSYDRGKAASAQGFLNFFGVQVERELGLYDPQQVIRSLESATRPASRFAVRQATGSLRVWDVTNPLRPVQRTVTLNGTSGEFTAEGGQLREFVLFTEEKAYEPDRAVAVPNQNLKGQPTPDLLVVTAPAWRAQAERLAAFRRQHDGLEVLVTTTQEIYNEFSSGQPDPTAIRDAARYFNGRKPGKLAYLLLFGDATYDYKGITSVLNAAQLASTVPVYESRESVHPVMSFSSDDYFGFWKPEEGEWPETFNGDHLLDVGIGRLPVRSVSEARDVVDKLIRYATDKTLAGDWQNRISFVADDGDYNIHQNDANLLADRIGELQPALRTEKVFVDDFPRQSTSLGKRAPGVNERLQSAINEGRLVINYSGHGGDSGWAEEQILTTQEILNWRNRRLPLMMTATCEFGRYDNPAITSGAELALLNRQGGAIALLTTTRPVYSNTNFILNQAFYAVLASRSAAGAPRLGDLVRETKNNSLAGSLNRNFTLLGDPSMRLAFPEVSVQLTRINGRNAGAPDTLSALEEVTLEGEVRQNGQMLAAFNGTVQLRLFDRASLVTTLGAGTESPKMTYRDYRSLLFSGQASVRNGRFTCRFVMPKGVEPTIDFGRIYAYAVRSDSLMTASGGLKAVPVGGTTAAPVPDTRPPVVQLFVNDTTFADGGTVAGPDVQLLARIADESGLNLVPRGTGGGISLQLNEEPAVDISPWYEADADNYRKGTVLYPLKNLKNGTYTVRLKAFDAYNNQSEAALKFIVSDRPGIRIESVTAGPNPFRESVRFWIRHNRAGEELEATLTISDARGRVLGQQRTECQNCSSVWNEIRWEAGQTAVGELSPGMYFYQIGLTSKTDGSRTVHSGKLLYSR
ncbi:type IX secretion system sortase PorU [Tellurirhabdus rosea]|uniref:type IX secretion system sortase PorU n=1 Tax=Tellurirhabdus rosea TaxID=2674997 RepID=UPI002254D055|nr:type IX secretion system sortase PorU [Tellurirhabdus rosea]